MIVFYPLSQRTRRVFIPCDLLDYLDTKRRAGQVRRCTRIHKAVAETQRILEERQAGAV